MTQIFFIRHGEAEGNIYRRAQGRNDLPLTARGRAQAACLAPRFAGQPLDAVFSSPYIRAYDTVEAALGDRPLTINKDMRLAEMCFGCWEGRPWGEIGYLWPREKELFKNSIEDWSVPGSESLAAVQERMWAFVEDVSRRYPGGTVAAGSHGMALKALTAGIRGVPFREAVLPDNTAVMLLQAEAGRCRIVYENDSSHLDASLKTVFGPMKELRFLPYDLVGGKERYVRCYADAWRVAHGSLRGFDGEACWQGVLYRAAQSPESLYSAWVTDDFAGILAMDDRRDARRGADWIAFFYVVPELRGMHCGMQLLGQAIAHARDRGRRALRLTVAPSNPAKGFYEKAGFVPAGREPGALEDLIVMEKEL